MNRLSYTCAALLSVAGCVAMSGCDTKAPGGDIVAKPASAPQTTPAPAPKSDPLPPKTDLDRSKLPASLKTDAYAYYGLSYPKPLDMEITSSDARAGVLTGSMAIRMTDVKADSATFSVEATGSLHDRIGDEVVALKPDGVYVVSSDMEKFTKPQLDLPTGFVAGKPWSVDSTVEMAQGKMRQVLKSSCKGSRNVKIGDTTYPALYVVGEGTYTGAGISARVVMREWFVKDIGVVKMELVQTPKGKPPV